MTGLAYNVNKNPRDLKPHPLNTQIYGVEVADEDLIDSIKSKGILEPIVIKDDNTILSGHRRWAASKELGIDRVPCRVLTFDDALDEAESLIEFNRQRVKNFTQVMNEGEYLFKIEFSRAEIRRKATEAKPGNQLAVKTVSPVLDTPLVNTRNDGRAKAIVADKVGMKRTSFYNATKIWEAAKAGNTRAKELVVELDAGENTINRAYNEIHKPKESPVVTHDDEPEPIVIVPIVDPTPAPEPFVHVSANSGNNEWYTPSNIIEAARTVMGSIDIDPASSLKANEVVKATRFYTVNDDGLTQEWVGNVWMNPPYSQPAISKFSETIVAKIESGEITQATVLVNNATETAWLQRMLACMDSVCFLKGRVRFIDPSGAPTGQPLQGQVVLYFGENTDGFETEFEPLGVIYNVSHRR